MYLTCTQCKWPLHMKRETLWDDNQAAVSDALKSSNFMKNSSISVNLSLASDKLSWHLCPGCETMKIEKFCSKFPWNKAEKGQSDTYIQREALRGSLCLISFLIKLDGFSFQPGKSPGTQSDQVFFRDLH